MGVQQTTAGPTGWQRLDHALLSCSALPSCRRAEQMASTGGDELEAVSTASDTQSATHTPICTPTPHPPILIPHPPPPQARCLSQHTQQYQHSQPAPCTTPSPALRVKPRCTPPSPTKKPCRSRRTSTTTASTAGRRFMARLTRSTRCNWTSGRAMHRQWTRCSTGCRRRAASRAQPSATPVAEQVRLVGWLWTKARLGAEAVRSRQPTQGGCFCGCDVQGSCEAFGVQMLTQCVHAVPCRVMHLLVLVVPSQAAWPSPLP